MKNTLREKMLRGERTIGSFQFLNSASVTDCLGLAGLDYLIIDGEHSAFDAKDVLEFSRTAKLYGITPLARVTEINRSSILRFLDAGAMGLIIPNVKSFEEAEAIVEWGKYAPIGKRGVSPSAGTDFWMTDFATQGFEHCFEVSNRETMLIPQCETVGCLENLEKIVALEGVNGIFIGPYDLSTSMGIPGQFQLKEFKDALHHIQKVCADAGKPTIMYAGNREAARVYFEMGFNSICYAGDASMLVDAYKSVLKDLK